MPTNEITLLNSAAMKCRKCLTIQYLPEGGNRVESSHPRGFEFDPLVNWLLFPPNQLFKTELSILKFVELFTVKPGLFAFRPCFVHHVLFVYRITRASPVYWRSLVVFRHSLTCSAQTFPLFSTTHSFHSHLLPRTVNQQILTNLNYSLCWWYSWLVMPDLLVFSFTHLYLHSYLSLHSSGWYLDYLADQGSSIFLFISILLFLFSLSEL